MQSKTEAIKVHNLHGKSEIIYPDLPNRMFFSKALRDEQKQM